jgi:fimbrial isopeptide formation D2 family protein/LPXTG-motif cell wall-anchored protein
MKTMKSLVALVLTLALALTLVGTAFASNVALTADTSISITGLASGDDVYLYQVIERDETTGGWKFTTAFADLGDDTADNYSANVKKIVDGDSTFSGLNKDDVEKIANIAKAGSAPSPVTLTGSTFTQDVAPGMYLALVAPVDVNTVYNPIIVSADYKAGGSNTIDTSATLGASAVTKKETVTLEKTTADITLDANEIVQFTVTTTIPAYADSYVEPHFIVSDSLSTGLKFVVDADHPFTVSSGSVGYSGAPATNDTSFTLTFTSANIAALTAPQAVTITYYARLTNEAPFNVNEETNDVTVEFSNNPQDDDDHSHLKDEVKEYTFSIDGTLFGNSDWTTGEVIKVGHDSAGNPLESVINLDNGSSHAALDGAEFGLYTDAACTTLYTNSVFNGTVTTANGGLMNIKGLDEGHYWLKEISAPAGYIKDQDAHEIVITAHTTTVTKTETLADGCEVTYDVTVLDSYTVTVDSASSTYTMTLSGPSISSVTPAESTDEIVNTQGLELPSTGGIGTVIFYVAGIILVLGAGAILVSRRKADAE